MADSPHQRRRKHGVLRRALKSIVRNPRLAAAGARLARLSEYGTAGYPPQIRRRLKILNVTAYLIAFFTAVYAVQQVLNDYQTWKPIIFINLWLIAGALVVPFLHRFGDVAAGLALMLNESIGLFVLTYYMGRDAGLHLQYFAGIAAFFLVLGLERLKLILCLTVFTLVLHLLAWAWFPAERALLPLPPSALAEHYVTAVVTTFSVIAIVVYYAFKLAETAQNETDALLHNILPGSIVDRLKEAPSATIADEVGEGSVMFADLKGFVALAQRLGPGRTVELLNTIMHAFDELAEQHQVEKIKTIGDAYMVASGVPEPAADHAERIAAMALAMLAALERIARAEDLGLALRIGIASGPLLAGVIGAKRLTYDVWGDTVNLASRLEGRSQPGRILVSQRTKLRLEGRFALEPCGPLDIKGFGIEEAWFLLDAPAASGEGARHGLIKVEPPLRAGGRRTG
jgi:adenylate cyclase